MNRLDAYLKIKWETARRLPNGEWELGGVDWIRYARRDEKKVLDKVYREMLLEVERKPHCEGKHWRGYHGDHEISRFVCPKCGRRLFCEIDEGGLCLGCGKFVVEVGDG